ncbi:MAG: gamma-glutamyltransferase [Gammaproteobacteria bacterium]|nr:MAG: gamma-glutamyltransferase [Gammaproteobacteria bacterium]
MNKKNVVLFLLTSLVFLSSPLLGEELPPKAAIASAHPLATQAGLDIFEKGGNAFDAAIAVTATLAVVEPYSSGLGGGGFYLLYQADEENSIMLDAREKAPSGAFEELYQDHAGNIRPGASVNGPLAAGIPGIPAALVHLAEHYGKLPLRKSLATAIHWAKKGFPADKRYIRMAGFRSKILQNSPAASQIFLDHGRPPAVGSLIKQPDLANTLTLLSQKGINGFYHGELARKLVKGVQDAGGIWTLDDLADYQVVERQPIRGKFNNWTLTTAAPPSSGGIVLQEMLNILSGYDLSSLERPQQINLIVEAMRRAYRDRSLYLGDPDFVDIPVEKLLSPLYAAGLRASIRPGKATPSTLLAPDKTLEGAGEDTTHFSIIDRQGNRVAATLSINFPFGSGFVPPGTGILLNDEMDDFSSKPGAPNLYGLIGGAANAIEPGKRPLSSMTPTFLERGDKVVIMGTPGGSRIISMVLLAILELDKGHNVEQIVTHPRFHHQYLPDVIQHEPDAFSANEAQQLVDMGYTLKNLKRRYGNMQAILWDRRYRLISAASDPRGIGTTGYFPVGE